MCQGLPPSLPPSLSLLHVSLSPSPAYSPEQHYKRPRRPPVPLLSAQGRYMMASHNQQDRYDTYDVPPKRRTLRRVPSHAYDLVRRKLSTNTLTSMRDLGISGSDPCLLETLGRQAVAGEGEREERREEKVAEEEEQRGSGEWSADDVVVTTPRRGTLGRRQLSDVHNPLYASTEDPAHLPHGTFTPPPRRSVSTPPPCGRCLH